MIPHFLNFLEKVPLTRSEKEELKKINKNEQRNFLPLYQILKNHSFTSEALELLSWGAAHFTEYQAAQVLLAKEYFYQGLIQQSWELLTLAKFDLRENVMAQRLLFQNAILLNFHHAAVATLKEMHIRQMTDAFIDLVGHTLKNQGLEEAQNVLRHTLEKEGVHLHLDYKVKSDPTVFHHKKPKNVIHDIQKFLIQDSRVANYKYVAL